MFRVTESETKSARGGGCRTIRSLIVTDAARSDFAARVGFTRGCVTRVAVVVRREVCGNGQARASLNGPAVARRTTGLRTRIAGVVLRVIELHVERFVEAGREVLQRWIVCFRVCVADEAHRDRRCRELAAMAVGAGFVAWKTGRRGVVGAFVTRVAGKRTML